MARAILNSKAGGKESASVESSAQALAASAEKELYSAWDFAGAERDFRRALELDPNLAKAHGNYAWYLQLAGRRDEGFAELRRAKEADPLNPLWPSWLAWQYWWYGEQYDKALEEARRSLEIDPDFAWALYVLGAVYAQQGMFDEAIVAHRRAAEKSPAARWGIGHTYALAGRSDEARRIAAELEKNPTPIDTWGLAQIYAAFGEKDTAIGWLEKGFEVRFGWMPWMEHEPLFAPLRGESGFRDLVRRLNLPR